MIKFSVIMPVYNSQERLKVSIESLINQTYKNWELISIDDGSNDDSLDILKDYAKKDNRIKVFHQENMGPGKARNFGIKKCTGDYIAFLDSDDYFDNNYFDIILDQIKKNYNIDVIFFGRIQEKNDGKITNINDVTKFKKYQKSDLIKIQLMGILPWGPCIKLAKSNIVKKCEFSDLNVGEELIYSFNLLKYSNNIVFIQDNLYHYVYNDNGQHKKGGIDPWFDVAISLQKYLTDINEIKKYDDAINGLAIKALLISVYRICINNKYKYGKIKIKEKIQLYSERFVLCNYNKRLLDFKSKILFLLLKFHFYFIVYIASKIKNKK